MSPAVQNTDSITDPNSAVHQVHNTDHNVYHYERVHYERVHHERVHHERVLHYMSPWGTQASTVAQQGRCHGNWCKNNGH